MRYLTTFFIIFLFCCLSCAPTTHYPKVSEELAQREIKEQKIIVVSELMKQQKRLLNVSYPILTKNLTFCEKKKSLYYGFMTLSVHDIFPKGFKEIYVELYNLGEYPKVVAVVKNSPAYIAGLKEGDVIVGVTSVDKLTNFKNFHIFLQQNVKDKVTLDIKRGNKIFKITIIPQYGCRYPVLLLPSDQVNAFTDGKKIYVSSGIMRFLQSDDELGLVVAHELAHCIMEHTKKQMGNAIIGGILGTAVTIFTGVDVTRLAMDAGRMMFSQEFEAEADYVGCYLAARAGYNVESAAQIWRKIAVFHPKAINMKGGSHPSTAKRFLAIQKAAKEIEEKKRANLPLIPE